MLLVKNPEKATISKINVNKAQKFIDKIDEQIDDIRTEVTNLEKQMDALNQDYAVLAPFKNVKLFIKRKFMIWNFLSTDSEKFKVGIR